MRRPTLDSNSSSSAPSVMPTSSTSDAASVSDPDLIINSSAALAPSSIDPVNLGPASALPADNISIIRVPKHSKSFVAPDISSLSPESDYTLVQLFSFFREPFTSLQFNYANSYRKRDSFDALSLPVLFYEDTYELQFRKSDAAAPSSSSSSSSSSASTPSASATALNSARRESIATARFASTTNLSLPLLSQLATETDDLTSLRSDILTTPHLILVKPVTSDIQHADKLSRLQDMLPLDLILTPFFDWVPQENAICKRNSIPEPDPNNLFLQKNSTSLCIKTRSLHFDSGDIHKNLEPFFCCLAIYDVKSQRKVTEDFHFDLNDEIILLMLGHHRGNSGEADPTLKIRSCIFTLDKARSEGLYLVVTIYRVYNAIDPDTALEPYLVSNTEKDKKRFAKAVATIKGTSQEACARFGDYRQAFAWGYTPLFAETGEPLVGYATRMNTLYALPPKHSILSLLTQQFDSKIRSTWKILPGFFLFDAVLLTSNMSFQNVYDPALRPIPSLSKALISQGAEPSSSSSSSPTESSPSTPTPSSSSSSAPSSSSPSSSSSSAAPADASPLGPSPSVDKDIAIEIAKNAKYLDPTRGIDASADDSVKSLAVYSTGTELMPHLVYKNLLWVSPQMLNYSSRTKYNCLFLRIALKDTDDSSYQGLPVFFGTHQGAERRTFLDSTVSFKTRTPSFNVEWKVELPIKLTPKHHLLITVWHLNSKKKKDNDEFEVLTGYSIIPLYQNSLIVSNNSKDFHLLPVVNAKSIPADYLSDPAPVYLDGGKPLLQVSLHLESSIYPQNQYVSALFNVFHFKEFFRDEEMLEALEALPLASPDSLVQYFPVIIDMLIHIMCSRKTTGDGPGMIAFKTLVLIVTIVQRAVNPPVGTATSEIRCAALLQIYVANMYSKCVVHQAKISPHTCLARNFFFFCSMLKHGSEASAKVSLSDLYEASWFIFQLIIKSLTLTIESSRDSSSKTIATQTADAQEAFKYIRELIRYLTQQFILKNLTERDDVGLLNRHLSLFITDLFNCFDLDQMYEIIRIYLEITVIDDRSPQTLPVLKFEFFDILCDNHHFIALNRPDNIQNIDFSSPDVERALAFNFPLITGLIESFVQCIRTTNIYAWQRSLKMLNSLISKHGWDSRFTDVTDRNLIASMYFSLVPALINNALTTAKFRSEVISRKNDINRMFYYPFLWVLKNINRNSLRLWWRHQTHDNLIIFLNLLAECVRCFEYDPSTKFIKSSAHASEELVVALNSYGCTQVNLLILDLLEDFLADFQSSLTKLDSETRRPEPLMKHLYALLLLQLNTRQSSSFLAHMFATLRGFITQFYTLIFFGKEKYCRQLISHTLLGCNSLIPSASEISSGFLYLLLKLNHSHNGEFPRLVSQAIMALSRLTDTSQIRHVSILQRSLLLFKQFAIYEYSSPSSFGFTLPAKAQLRARSQANVLLFEKARFCRSVEEIAETLTKLLADSILIREAKKKSDIAQTCDIYWRIANSYRETPSLRIEWLNHLANYHITNSQFAEAAICLVHIVALIYDFLETNDLLPSSASKDVLKVICPTLNEVSDGAIASDQFSLSGLIKAADQAISHFEKASLFEYGALLHKLLLPIFEDTANYAAMSTAHQKLQSLWSAVEAASKSDTRFFADYYRVGLFSKKFGDLNGQTFVYKLPPFSHLFSLTEALQKMFESLVGEPVIVWKKGSIDPSELDPLKCYMHIGAVKIHIGESEAHQRNSLFKENNCVDSFEFFTPFTRSSSNSQAQTMVDQFLRKTIIKVANPFPYMTTRQPVVTSREIIVTPIQTAQEVITKQLNLFKVELRAKPVNSKGLERLLQGSVLTTVNQGPVQIGREFLSPTARKAMAHDPWSKKDMDNLCDLFREFLSICGEALAINDALCKDDERAAMLQIELKAGYAQLKQEILDYLSQIEFDPNEEDPTSTSATDHSEREGKSGINEADDSEASMSMTAEDDSEHQGSPSFSNLLDPKSQKSKRHSGSSTRRKDRSASLLSTTSASPRPNPNPPSPKPSPAKKH